MKKITLKNRLKDIINIYDGNVIIKSKGKDKILYDGNPVIKALPKNLLNSVFDNYDMDIDKDYVMSLISKK